MTDDNFHKLALSESFERVAKVAEERQTFNKAMDNMIAQDADLIEKTRPLSNERDLGQPWLRTYDAHLKVECARCCGNGQTYGPNSGEDIICPDCNGKGRI